MEAHSESFDGEEASQRVGLYGLKVFLRPIEEHDAPLLRILMNDVSVAANVVGFSTPVSMAGQIAWQNSQSSGGPDGPWRFTVVDQVTGSAVGATTIHSVDWRLGTAQTGIKIHPAFQGRGFAYDACMTRNAWAFFAAGIRRLEAPLLAFNEASFRLYERLGYTLEGRSREAVLRDGKWCDVLNFGLLRSDAENMPDMAPYRTLVTRGPSGHLGARAGKES